MLDWQKFSVLVTGGTGSFGRMFTDIMLRDYKPRRLIVFSRDELKQDEMRRVYSDSGGSPIRYFIGDVRDRERLQRAMRGVDIVVHAAALKQVPACEYNPFEAVQTNVLGGKNVVDAALDCGVERAMLISTDKAVNPVNLYGATKLCAEKMFVQSNAYSVAGGTRFSCARYGNVVGSRGSVVPLFFQQRETGVLTITDERMTRFWLTLEQGVRFVIGCLEQMLGGEIFVPRVPSMRVRDLAEAIAPQARLEVIGIRPGEKLHEVLVSEEEGRHCVRSGDRYIIMPTHKWWNGGNWQHSEPVPEPFSYSSHNNDRWFTIAEMRQLLDRMGIPTAVPSAQTQSASCGSS